jgi:hypothetical protein
MEEIGQGGRKLCLVALVLVALVLVALDVGGLDDLTGPP